MRFATPTGQITDRSCWRSSRSPAPAAVSPLKNPAKTDISDPIAPFQRTPLAALRSVDENRTLPYKPRQLSAMARFSGGGSFGAVNGLVLGRPASPDLPQFGFTLTSGKLPGQRRTTREADLSTQQTGAQAPSRLPRPSRHDRRPQGSRRAPCTWPQAPERLSRIFRRLQYGSA